MKAFDIVNQLCVLLPQLTDKFTDNILISSITRNGTLMTVQCLSEHDLEENQAVCISNSTAPITINTLTRSGITGTLVTATNHDLTNGIAPTIEITGATEAEFNGTFTLINVDNRKTIRFQMVDSGPTTATGTPLLLNAESAFNDYNSTYKVESVPTPTSFTFVHPVVGLANPIAKPNSTMVARTEPRISAGIDIDRIIEGYTEQDQNDYWLFVTLGDVVASQSRLIESDAIDNQQKNVNYRQQIVEPFSVYVFIPVENEIAARESRDEISDLFRPILRSLLFSKISTGLYADKLNSVQFSGHSTYNYNTAVYVHQFGFQQVAEIYEEDTTGHDLDVAFRDIDFTQYLDFGNQVDFLRGTPDLDDTPL